jgi:uncharacterized protein YjbK
MNKVEEALMSEEEKRARKLENQRRVVCPEGSFVFIHKNCLDETMILMEKKSLTVYPGQIEEFATQQVLEDNNIDSVGCCDCCRKEINVKGSSFYRLWVLTKSDYEKNVEYRKGYEVKKEKLQKKRLRHEKWQRIESKTPYILLGFIRYIRKIAYKLFK